MNIRYRFDVNTHIFTCGLAPLLLRLGFGIHIKKKEGSLIKI